MPISCSNPRNANKTQAKRLGTRGPIGTRASQAPGGPPPDAQILLGTATIGPFYEHQTIVFLEEYYTWHTRLPMYLHLCAQIP